LHVTFKKFVVYRIKKCDFYFAGGAGRKVSSRGNHKANARVLHARVYTDFDVSTLCACMYLGKKTLSSGNTVNPVNSTPLYTTNL
jgi:hypothetical protein